MVRPARRLIPGLWGLDLATLALAWLVQLVEILVVLQIKGYAARAGGRHGRSPRPRCWRWSCW